MKAILIRFTDGLELASIQGRLDVALGSEITLAERLFYVVEIRETAIEQIIRVTEVITEASQPKQAT